MTAGGSIGEVGATLASVRGATSDTLSPMPPTEPPVRLPATLRHIVITGLMGSGKTTVGSRLAARLGWPWRDSDADIEAASGLTVHQLGDREGVDAMHAREAADLLDALVAPEPNVISAAASVIDSPACRAAMIEPGVAVIWLHAEPALLAERFRSADDHRPVFGDVPEAFLAEQAARREPLLADIGAHVIDVDRLTPDEEVARALEMLG
jgi:shikimate kinase